MALLDPAQLRAYVERDWRTVGRLDLIARASQPIEVKMRLAMDLYEAARATVPGWPRDEDRAADLAHHVAVRTTLRRLQAARTP